MPTSKSIIMDIDYNQSMRKVILKFRSKYEYGDKIVEVDDKLEKGIIIYGSHYGTGKEYAEELAKRTNMECISYEDIKDINNFDAIVYIGSLYAGGVLGMKKTLDKLSDIKDKQIIIATVGLADPCDETNKNNIRNSIKHQVTNEIYENAHIYHLRGGIDYSKLNLKHKFMMSLLYKKVKSLPEERKDAEARAMIETYNKEVNFVDFSTLGEIICDLEK